MSSVSSISSALGSSLQQELASAVSNNNTADAKAAATVIQQTQAQSYLGGLLASVEPNDFAGTETLQVMNSVLATSNAAVLNQISASSQAAPAVAPSDITNTPFTQATDENGQLVNAATTSTASTDATDANSTNDASAAGEVAGQVTGDIATTPFTQGADATGQIFDVSV
jgi:hypothetical protein